MLATPLGTIVLTVDGTPVEYSIKPLKLFHVGTRGLPVFEVEGRYRIEIFNLQLPTAVACYFTPNQTYSSGINSGERLALKTWSDGSTELSIGTEDEIPGTAIQYLDNGIKISFAKNAKAEAAIFQTAWLTIRNTEIESDYTWFAADPSYTRE